MPRRKLAEMGLHLVYASMHSSECNKDLILMFIMSQLRTVFFSSLHYLNRHAPPLWRCDEVLKPNFSLQFLELIKVAAYFHLF